MRQIPRHHRRRGSGDHPADLHGRPGAAYWRAAHAPAATPHGRRDLAFVPVTGLPGSVLGLVHHTARENARVRAFRTGVTEIAG
ncbi:hypothetical protein [Streptomyces platensis]|uniref:hypothetical protein n=1 Tax=Streptomyces platensis TaxID=58346 RepID=UPI00386937B4|nr:hypothetical protein OG962_18580 [Streptomyces platensis]